MSSEFIQWQKQGLVFAPSGQGGWMNSHAQVPTPLVRKDRIRIYFATRPRQDLSLTTFVDVDRDDPARVLHLNEQPILELGPPGSFDEHGIMPSCALEKDGLVHLYYSGWSRRQDIPYANFTGLAVSEDGGTTFRKHESSPVLGPTAAEPYSATSPLVLYNGAWHMWYSCGTHWLDMGGKREHTYDLRYCHSNDGIRWQREGEIAIAQRTAQEAVTRPAILEWRGRFHMWFAFRGSQDFRGGTDSYRIGYAHSPDLRHWERRDDRAGLDCSPAGWDAHMIAYPAVVRVGDRALMFYNGDGFGVGGFGFATASDE